MKKFLLGLMAIILCVPALVLAGCGKDGGINMSTYFESKVNYQVYPRNSINDDLTLKSFTDSRVDHMDSYSEIAFTGARDYIYKLHIDKVCFELYANMDKTVEFIFTISNLSKGDQGSSGGNTQFTEQIEVHLKKNKPVKVSIDVDDYVAVYTSTTTIRLKVTDRVYFIEDGVETGLKYDMINFMVYGEHKK